MNSSSFTLITAEKTSKERLLQDLQALQQDFTKKVKILREEYFNAPEDLLVISGKGDFEVGFAINNAGFKNPG